MRCSWRRLGAALAVVSGVLALAVPAGAHASLVGSDPEPSAVLDESPAAIRLEFSEPVPAELAEVRLLTADRTEIDLGEPTVDPADASTLVTPVPELDDGGYVAAWRVTSADGHPIDGAFAFQVGSGTFDTAAVLAQVDAAQGADPTVDKLVTLARFAVFVGLALVLGGLVMVLAISLPTASDPRARLLLWTGWALLAVGSLGWFLLAGAHLTGRGLGAVSNTALWSDVAHTRPGRATLARMAGLAALVPVLVLTGRGVGRPLRWLAALAGVFLVATVALSGHAGTGRQPVLGVVVGSAHLAAMSVWLGGLAMLALVVLVPRAESVGAAVAAPAIVPKAERERAVERFSPVAAWCVGVVVLTGTIQSWRMLDTPGDLVDTAYGRRLLVKLVLVAAVVGLGWWARRLLHEGEVGRQLWRAVGTEAAVALAVLAITAALVGTPPPEQKAAAQPFGITLVQSDVLLDVLVVPATTGPNDVHLTFAPPGGSLAEVGGVEARLVAVDRADLGPLPVELAPAGPNHYLAEGVQVPFAGPWRLEVVADTSDDRTVRFTTQFDVAAG